MPKTHIYYVYILTNKGNTVINIGVTNDVRRRVWEHKKGHYKGFTQKYSCNKLVYYETFQWIQDAIAREKQKSRFKTKENRPDKYRKSNLE